MVLRPYVHRALVARTSTYTMSQSDGTTDVPASRDSCYPKAKVRKWPMLFFVY